MFGFFNEIICFTGHLLNIHIFLQLEEVETALMGKREQVEELKRAMMTENLEALSLTPADRRMNHSTSGGALAGGGKMSSRLFLRIYWLVMKVQIVTQFDFVFWFSLDK